MPTQEYLDRLERLSKAGLKPGDKINDYFLGHKYVACIGGIGDWAVYTGQDDWDWDHIASNGDKVPVDIAHRIFPDLVDLSMPYRY